VLLLLLLLLLLGAGGALCDVLPVGDGCRRAARGCSTAWACAAGGEEVDQECLDELLLPTLGLKASACQGLLEVGYLHGGRG
jgi:hypothetical protein